MEFQKTKILRYILALIVSIAIFVLISFIFVSALKSGHSGSVLFGFLLLFIGLCAWSSYQNLKFEIKSYKNNKQNNELVHIVLSEEYSSYEKMVESFKQEKACKLYEDDEIMLTENFLAEQDGRIFVIDGILDVKPLVSKVNGIIDYVSLSILYLDGRKYEFKYRRPIGFHNMKDKAKQIEMVANVIASKSKNFRSNSSFRL